MSARDYTRCDMCGRERLHADVRADSRERICKWCDLDDENPSNEMRAIYYWSGRGRLTEAQATKRVKPPALLTPPP